MNQFLHGVARATAEAFPLRGPVLEVGSFLVPGQEGVGDLRPLFPGRDYVGLDMRPGPGVDVVGDVENLGFPAASFGTVVALSTFEHVRRFWRGFDEVFRVLRPDGALFVSVPFDLHLHGYPSDYWRFTAEALDLLLDRYPRRVIGTQGPRTKPHNVWALALRERADPVTPAQLADYRRLIGEYARQPLPWGRRARYWLGRLLCGRRPFTPWFDRERWGVELKEGRPLERDTAEDRRAPARGDGVRRQLELPGPAAGLPAVADAETPAGAAGGDRRR
ncbi:MAG: class I SAM-dependent methyltransferase [Gemmataceae bacterium]